MASHNPKPNSYSTTESSDFRFAVTVAHKNLGEGFSTKVMYKAKINYGSSLLKFIKKTDETALKRKAEDELPVN